MGVKEKAKEFWLFSRPHLPSVVTLMALTTAFSGVYAALHDNSQLAVILVWAGGFLDALDGRLARYLDECSQFGAEIDSLADLVSFGVSPALFIYLHILHKSEEYSFVGWFCACTYICCMAIRLARFNVTHAGAPPVWSKSFFKGVPAPAGASILMAPIYFQIAGMIDQCSPRFFCGWLLFCATLLVSSIRTFSGKGLYIPGRNRVTAPKMALPVLALMIVSCFYFLPAWYIPVLLAIAYMCSFPISHMIFLKWCSFEEGQLKKDT